MKKTKRGTEPQDSLEQFRAYDAYSYSYQAAEEEKKAQHKGTPVQEPLPGEPYAPYETQPPRPSQHVTPAAETAKARSRSITGRLIFLLTVAIITIIVLQGTVFRLETVYVVGNEQKTAQQIAAASGLVKGLNIFSISEDEIRQNLSSDHTLIFQGMQKDYPNTIYLYVTERHEVAAMQWLGLQYTLDATGLVMSESSSLLLPEGMPSVTGMQVVNIHVGQRLEVKDSSQLTVYCDILSELDEQMFSDQVSEINLSSPDSYYLVTTDGISVRLGDGSSIRAKIGALRTDIAYLRQLGKSSGTLDVSIPEDAKYTPDS